MKTSLHTKFIPTNFWSRIVPKNKKRDIDYVMSLMDWEKNIDPHYKKHYFRQPIVCRHSDEAAHGKMDYLCQ